MLPSCVVNKPKAPSTETQEEDNTLLNPFTFLDKAVVTLNGLTNQLRSG